MVIELNNLKPQYMSESEVAGSDIYLQPTVRFEQGRRYLVCARSGHGKTSLLNFIYGSSHRHDGSIRLLEIQDPHPLPPPCREGTTKVTPGSPRFPSLQKRESSGLPGRALCGGRVAEGQGGGNLDTLRQRHLSYLFQDLRLFPSLTALENVHLKNNLTHHKSDGEIRDMLAALLPAAKLAQPVGTLSLGQRQRVAAVRALCQPFDFLLMDEPFSHLDSDSAALVAALVDSEVTAQHAGLIVTTLDPSTAFAFDTTLRL